MYTWTCLNFIGFTNVCIFIIIYMSSENRLITFDSFDFFEWEEEKKNNCCIIVYIPITLNYVEFFRFFSTILFTFTILLFIFNSSSWGLITERSLNLYEFEVCCKQGSSSLKDYFPLSKILDIIFDVIQYYPCIRTYIIFSYEPE